MPYLDETLVEKIDFSNPQKSIQTQKLYDSFNKINHQYETLLSKYKDLK